MKKTFYITTPIYYTSGKLHLGHCYTTALCDAVARFQKMRGLDVFYLTGTDEHGQSVEESAAKAGKTPKEYVDFITEDIKALWRAFGIKYDKFIRTTDKYHERAIQKVFTALYEKGDIYKSKYSGLYCVPCESFWTATQAKDGKCPDCGRSVKTAEEESYFFRLSAYGDKLLKFYAENPGFIEPASRGNEMAAFVKQGLNDLAVSRSTFKWGVPVPFDKKHVVYVWIDALFNYMTALGFFGDKSGGKSDDKKDADTKYWPADVHVVGKEITRFHAVYWPALLMAMNLPLPKQIYSHGWLLFNSDKISKSKGNAPADPLVLIGRYGADAVRYFLLKEISGGNDGNYTHAGFITRINSDLCNDLGNLLNRAAAMVGQYRGGVIPKKGAVEREDAEMENAVKSAYAETAAHMPLSVSHALSAVFKLIRAANKYVDGAAPWNLHKDGSPRLDTVLYNLADALYTAAALLLPFIPETAEKILASLNMPVPKDFKKIDGKCGNVTAGVKIVKIPPLYPRLDAAKEADALSALMNPAPAAGEKTGNKEENKMENKEEKKPEKGIIGIDEFAKTDLRVARVTACEKIEKSDKLLKLTVEVGAEKRTVVSGIAQYYAPEELVGKSVVLVANLAPIKLRGVESRGMILCAAEGDKVIVVSPEKPIASGAEVR